MRTGVPLRLRQEYKAEVNVKQSTSVEKSERHLKHEVGKKKRTFDTQVSILEVSLILLQLYTLYTTDKVKK